MSEITSSEADQKANKTHAFADVVIIGICPHRNRLRLFHMHVNMVVHQSDQVNASICSVTSCKKCGKDALLKFMLFPYMLVVRYLVFYVFTLQSFHFEYLLRPSLDPILL